MTYRDALQCILRNFTILVVLPITLLESSFLSRVVGKACREFKLYMKESIDRQTNTSTDIHEKAGEGMNLLSALVTASHREEQGLSDDEMYGNIFIYNMAGHETTANALATSIMYLAIEPAWQDWVHKEIIAETTNDEHHEAAFLRLNRCKAIMLETLRLHGSVVFLPKVVKGEVSIPEGSFITINIQAIHCNPEIWGKDVLEWGPSRWIQRSDSGPPGNEVLIEPRQGTSLAWADGPRICPGKKLSQVEFRGVLSTLLRNHRVVPMGDNDENDEVVQKRLAQMIEDSAITAITLQMKRPRDVLST